MIPVLDPFMASASTTGIQRGRGGFYRSKDGAPYVSDPSGELCKSGARKGEVKRLKYGSPSSAGTLIENDVGLTKHKQRKTFLGIGMSEELREACKDLALMEYGTDEFNTAADTIVVKADTLTRSWLAADRGTHGHLLCELWDRSGGHLTLTPEQVAAGEAVDLTPERQRDVIPAWQNLLTLNGLEILAVESSCVDDAWRLAGTLDRLVKTTRPLTFVKKSGEIVTVPAGIVIVLDLKFGKCRKAHPIQIASYAQSVPYDTETEVRGEWPFTIDQTHALIAHGDFGDDTRPVTIELVWVDLAAGRDHGGETVVQAKAWAARDDVFSVAQLDDNRIAEVAEALGPDVEGEEGAPFADLAPSTPLADAPDLTASATTGEAACGKPATSPVLSMVDAKAALNQAPDQGADLATGFDELWDQLKAEFAALDDAARSWRGELVNAAQRHNVPFHVQEVRTERTYHINRALISLASSGCDNDELLRAVLDLIVGEVALFPSIHPGHVVGSLTAKEAEQLATLVDQFHAGEMKSSVDNDGTLRLTAA